MIEGDKKGYDVVHPREVLYMVTRVNSSQFLIILKYPDKKIKNTKYYLLTYLHN